MVSWTPRVATTTAASAAVSVTSRATNPSCRGTAMSSTSSAAANKSRTTCVKWARCWKRRTSRPTTRSRTWSGSAVIENIPRMTAPSGPRRREVTYWIPPYVGSLSRLRWERTTSWEGRSRVAIMTVPRAWFGTTVIGGRDLGRWWSTRPSADRARAATTESLRVPVGWASGASIAHTSCDIIIVLTRVRRGSPIPSWMKASSAVSPAITSRRPPGPPTYTPSSTAVIKFPARFPTRSRSSPWRRSAWALPTAGSWQYVEFPLRRRSCLTWYIRRRKWDTLPTIVCLGAFEEAEL